MMKADIGLLFLRISSGLGMLLAHGLGKLTNFQAYAPTFPDPIGMGSTISLGMAVFSEVFCAAALIFGLGTRLVSAMLASTMAVAFFIVHAGDPFAKKELAFTYLIMYLVIILTGPGKYSVDAFVFNRK